MTEFGLIEMNEFYRLPATSSKPEPSAPVLQKNSSPAARFASRLFGSRPGWWHARKWLRTSDPYPEAWSSSETGRIPYGSHPYECCFSGLKDLALLPLDTGCRASPADDGQGCVGL